MSVQPIDLKSITIFRFELKDREKEIKQLAQGTCKNFVSFYSQSQHKKHWSLFSICGASGTGKTRLSITALLLVREEVQRNKQEYIEYIEAELQDRVQTNLDPNLIYDLFVQSLQQERAHTLYVDFSNGDNFPEWDNKKTLETAFLFSLASKTFFPNAKVGSIRADVPEGSFSKFSPFQVAKALHDYHQVGPQETLTIFINIDEFQKKVSNDDLKKILASQKESIPIRQIASAVMSACQTLASQNTYRIHVIPIFSGTLSMHYIGIFPATDYYLVSVFLGPIQSESSYEIVNAALKNCKLARSLIESMGNIPRALEYLVNVTTRSHSYRTGDTNSTDTAKFLFDETVKMIQETYIIRKHTLAGNIFKTLIRLCLSGKKVSKDEEIDGIPLGSLEKDGVIFLKPISNGLFRIHMPLVFVAAFNRALGLFDSNFVTYKPILGPEAMEKFGQEFDVFRNNLLVDMGIKETTFGERFSGALMSDILKDTKIRLTQMRAFDSKKDQLPENGTAIEFMVPQSGKPEFVDLAKESACIWIGRNCTVCDNIASYPNQVEDKTFIRLEEWKSTLIYQEATSAVVKPGDIKSEREKAITSHTRKTFLDQNKWEIYFSFMSNKNLPTTHENLQKEILSHNDTMIVSLPFCKSID